MRKTSLKERSNFEIDLTQIGLEELNDPKTAIDKYRKAFIIANLHPVHQKLTNLINSEPGKETKERDLQVKTLWKFAESVGSLGAEDKQAASVTKIYQKNTLVIKNPLIQQIIQEHCRSLAPNLYPQIEAKAAVDVEEEK